VASTALPLVQLFDGPFGKIWFRDGDGAVGFANGQGTVTAGTLRWSASSQEIAADSENVWLLSPNWHEIERFHPRTLRAAKLALSSS
jgi:hypothetical protein